MVEEADVLSLVADQLFPKWRTEKKRLDRIDRWYRWDHDRPHSPRSATPEYRELSDRSQAPWGGLVVTSLAQQMYVEGYRSPGSADDAVAWQGWQANGMDARQIPLHRAAVAYGLSYEVILPGTAPGPDGTTVKMPVARGVSPRRMMAFYEDVVDDEWPEMALRVDWSGVGAGWKLRLIDDERVWTLKIGTSSDKPELLGSEIHEMGFCPVVRFANMLDLEGRADGEVEPFIPVLARIDQTAFDRLVVQRFASWIVRTISGMSAPDSTEAMLLKVSDLLVAEDKDTKFGSLPATPLSGFIEAHDNDVKTLAALTQTPAHELLGQMANLSAEALAAAEASLTRKVTERKHTMGESHEQALRTYALIMGDNDGARDYSAEVRWADMESRSLSQAADALGKLAQMLQVPVELLWTKIPGFTDADIAEATRLAEEQGGLANLLREMTAGLESAPDDPAPLPVG